MYNLIPSWDVDIYPAGQLPTGVHEGDFYLTSGTSWLNKQIHKIQGYKYDPVFASFNHAGIFNKNGDCVEFLERGPEIEDLRKYYDTTLAVIHPLYDDKDRFQVSYYVDEVLGMEKFGYSFLTICFVFVQLRLGGSLQIQRKNTGICSAFVAEALTRAGYVFPKHPTTMLPADLAMFFDARKV